MPALSIPKSILEEYTYAAATFIQQAYQHNSNANITVSGHSLGGALAQLIGKRTGLSAYGFNAHGSAGVYSLLEQDLDYSLNNGANPWMDGPLGNNPNVNYRIDTDQVSLAGTSFPSVFTIASPHPLPTFDAPYLPQFFLNSGTFLENHSIATVKSQLAISAPITAGIPSYDQNVIQDLEDFANPTGWYFTSSSTSGQGATYTYDFAFPANAASGTIIDPAVSGIHSRAAELVSRLLKTQVHRVLPPAYFLL